MDLRTLTDFFIWCSVINGGLLVLWTLAVLIIPETVYRLQNWWMPIPRETHNLVMYSFLGLFKVIFLVFNLVPLVALLIAG
jgi:hypothetical protein